MDIFVDKLAQRATAQEIIKANTAADVEELNRLKNQVVEYNECLTRLQALIDDGSGKLEKMRSGDDEIRKLVQEGLEGVRDLRKALDGLEQCQKKALDQMAGLDKTLASQLGSVAMAVESKLDGMDRLTEAQLTERLNALEENVHKECVKVYRNVQAVVTEESGRQGEALGETKKEASAVKGKLGTILGISVAAMILSLAGVVLQVLGGLGVPPF